MTTLVAGLGNIFNGDDGFGVEVASSLLQRTWPDDVEVADFGIRGVHLAYQLLDGYELVVIVDAVSHGGAPGSLYVIEHRPDEQRPIQPGDQAMIDAHDLGPDGVLALVPSLGGTLGRVVVVGCEPETLAPGVGLSAAVAGSVEAAVELVREIVEQAQVGVRRHEEASDDAETARHIVFVR
jgi:hydrogenase maturation protease